MIAYLKGKVAAVTESSVIIDVNQVGYLVFISGRDAADLPRCGEMVQVYTWMSVSQDALRLYGFLSEDDLEIFKLLISVSGIGPKAAQGLLGAMTADDLRFAVLADDARTISKAPGIGAKTAKKLILELKDKLSLEEAIEHRMEAAGAETAVLGKGSAREEAVQALAALGYSASDALRAVKKAEITDEMDTETILKLALKQMI